MEKRQTGIIRSKVDFDFAEGLNEHDILQNARRRLAIYLRELEGIVVEMYWMSVVGRIYLEAQ